MLIIIYCVFLALYNFYAYRNLQLRISAGLIQVTFLDLAKWKVISFNFFLETIISEKWDFVYAYVEFLLCLLNIFLWKTKQIFFMGVLNGVSCFWALFLCLHLSFLVIEKYTKSTKSYVMHRHRFNLAVDVCSRRPMINCLNENFLWNPTSLRFQVGSLTLETTNCHFISGIMSKNGLKVSNIYYFIGFEFDSLAYLLCFCCISIHFSYRHCYWINLFQ